MKWADDLVESDAVAKRYPELKFSISQGIHYISPNEMIHAGSLLAYHPASQSLHVDDTFMSPPMKLLEAILPELILHPTTKKALKNGPQASNIAIGQAIWHMNGAMCVISARRTFLFSDI